MATNIKALTDVASRFVNTSLDNVKHFIDRTADEVAKADVIGANRRLADQMIESAKDTVSRAADSASRAEALDAVLVLATGTLEGARDTVRVAAEESQRINLVETGSRVLEEGLDLTRRQLELGVDASREAYGMVNRLMPFKVNPVSESRPVGVVTRVEIESDKGTIKAEPVGAK